MAAASIDASILDASGICLASLGLSEEQRLQVQKRLLLALISLDTLEKAQCLMVAQPVFWNIILRSRSVESGAGV